MFASFIVTQGHALSKELAGGRVRVRAGEDLAEAVSRRVAQDARCHVLEVKAIAAEGAVDGDVQHYELRLRGWLPQPARGRTVSAEGSIRVRVLSGPRACGPLGAETVSVRRSPRR